MVKGKRGSGGGRGSTEAIEKRRVARQLNALFSAGNGERGKLDGRTEKRRLRLLKELKEGRRGQPLKPIEVVSHADELLSLGETLGSIRKNGVRTAKLDPGITSDQLEAVQRTQAAYGFRPEVWRLLGIELHKAGGGSLPSAGRGADDGRSARLAAGKKRRAGQGPR
jgi:hypothetical protein